MVTLNVLKDNSHYSEFYYGDGVTIWFANNTNVQSNGPVLHIREVRFLNNTYPTQDQVIKFEGKITNIYHKDSSKFDEGSSIEEIPLPTPLQYEKRKEKLSWFQNHKRWLKKRPISNRGNEPIENILFTPRGTDSTLIQTVIGYVVDVGTKPEREVGTFDDVFVCENDDLNNYDKSKLLTKVVLHLDEERMFLDEKTFPLYFELEKTEVYKCTKENDSFLRVITEFRGKTGIKQVNYYDGVKVFRKSIQLGVDTALIVEQKYLDPTDFKVIKYVGKLEKKS